MGARKPVPQASVTWDQTSAFRLARMHLVEQLRRRSLRRVARDLGGIQAQVHSAAELQCAVRMDGLATGAVERALYKSRTLVKTWMMRGTIHYLDPSDLPVWASASATRRTWNKPYWQKAFGISAEDVRAAIETIPKALDGTCLTREALADEVHRITRNAALDELMRAGWGSVLKIVAAEGRLCFGPNEGRKVTFTRPEQWLEEWREPPPVEDALGEVFKRYLASHGPATREEFARWWGFNPAGANEMLAALGDQVLLVDREGDRAYILSSDLASLEAAVEDDHVRMLPMFDAYTLAALPHDSLVPKVRKSEVYRKGAWVSQVVTRGGRVVGVWTHESKPKGTTVHVKLFRKNGGSRADVEAALAPYTSLIGEVTKISIA
ncbi:MAG: winged helix DNA-binding domain-containing protein [Actinomycetota bacterium]